MEEKLKIAHIIDSFAYGGAEKLLLTFVEAVKDTQVQVLVISLMHTSHNTRMASRLRSMGAEVIELSYRKLYDIRCLTRLASIFRSHHIDLVHTHLSQAIIMGSIAAKISDIPSVTTIHNTHSARKGKWGFRSYLEAFCLRLPGRVIAVGENVEKIYIQILGREKVVLIPNCVALGEKLNAEERLMVRMELTGFPDEPIALSVGRLKPQKAYPDMLVALSLLVEQGAKISLAVVGIGDQLEMLKQKSAELNISERVRFLGARDDVSRLMAGADLFLNSSHWEGLSIAMLEAMASGLPVVATEVGDARALLSSGGGVLTPPGNPQKFADGIRDLLQGPDRLQSMGMVARDYVARNYGVDEWLASLFACYEMVRLESSRERNL